MSHTSARRSWKGKRDLAALVLMGIGGLRAGEVCSLRLCDVDLKSERVTLRVRGKGNRLRAIALEGKNAGPIRSWAAIRGTGVAHSPWFIARKTENGEQVREMTVASLDYIVRSNARGAELTGVHAHLLRHCAASDALAGGMNLIEVRDMLGHASIVTTSRYLHGRCSSPSHAAVI